MKSPSAEAGDILHPQKTALLDLETGGEGPTNWFLKKKTSRADHVANPKNL